MITALMVCKIYLAIGAFAWSFFTGYIYANTAGIGFIYSALVACLVGLVWPVFLYETIRFRGIPWTIKNGEKKDATKM